ncbi:MAG: 5-formyltetrahydrofolate cyclo-ligase [Desulfotomaculum sp. 46_296]|nr:MAG: 5-formyltetrahydrofolate cyclo-ligase [Desulfotomaculum sp. 46_296]HAU31431.1 5-formyltetrahydrofolate cyclo-ligase [Desulfotomaculum sp.]
MNKNEIRKQALALRMALSPEEVSLKSSLITEKILSLEEYRRANVIMTYLDFRNEVKTGELIQRTMKIGKKIAVPATDLKNIRLTPSLLLAYPDDLSPGAWGIPEPARGRLRPVKPAEIDIVIVPGIAFDEKGNRIGYGMGFYDRFLMQIDAFLLAPVFEMQIRPAFSPGPHDRPVDCLVTEERVIYTKQLPSP